MDGFKYHNQLETIFGYMKALTPSNVPRMIGKKFIIRAFVDANFLGNSFTRHPKFAFIVMLNSAPKLWLSKKLSSMETISVGSDSVAILQCCKYLKVQRYKLRIMGTPISNPCFIYGDYQSVLWNTSIPDSMSKKKTATMAYHFVPERVS